MPPAPMITIGLGLAGTGQGEAMMFNTLAMDLHPYVADRHFAEKEGLFGKRLVAGAQVFPMDWD